VAEQKESKLILDGNSFLFLKLNPVQKNGNILFRNITILNDYKSDINMPKVW
jgi:hypothetical protein